MCLPEEAPSLPVRANKPSQLKAVLCDLGNTSREATRSVASDPSVAVQSWHGRRPSHAMQALLVDGDNATKEGEIIPESSRDATTVSGRTASKALIVNTREMHGGKDSGAGREARSADEPIYSLAATSKGNRHKAVLVDCVHRTGADLTQREEDEPSHTVVATPLRRPITAPKRWLEQGKVVAMTPRCLARFMGVPDSYPLPAKSSLATTIIGNGCACDLQAAVVLPLLRALMEKGATR